MMIKTAAANHTAASDYQLYKTAPVLVLAANHQNDDNRSSIHNNHYIKLWQNPTKLKPCFTAPAASEQTGLCQCHSKQCC